MLLGFIQLSCYIVILVSCNCNTTHHTLPLQSQCSGSCIYCKEGKWDRGSSSCLTAPSSIQQWAEWRSHDSWLTARLGQHFIYQDKKHSVAWWRVNVADEIKAPKPKSLTSARNIATKCLHCTRPSYNSHLSVTSVCRSKPVHISYKKSQNEQKKHTWLARITEMSWFNDINHGHFSIPMFAQFWDHGSRIPKLNLYEFVEKINEIKEKSHITC